MIIPLLIIIAKPPILCHSVVDRWFCGLRCFVAAGHPWGDAAFWLRSKPWTPAFACGAVFAQASSGLIAAACLCARRPSPSRLRPAARCFPRPYLALAVGRSPPAAFRHQPPPASCRPAATRSQPPAVPYSARPLRVRNARKRLFIGRCPPVTGADVALLLILDSVLYNGCRPIGVLVA